MHLQSVQKRFKRDGIINGALYYGCHLISKLLHPVVGKGIQKFGTVKKERLVLKNRIDQDFTDNARALFEYMIHNDYNEKYEIIYLVSNKHRFRANSYKYKNVKFVTAENRFGWTSPMAYYYAGTAGCFFYTNNTADMNKYRCEGQTVVNLWHGCGYKGSVLNNDNVGHTQSMGYFDYAIVPGPVFVETKSKYWACSKDKILPLGYPRYDWMLDPYVDAKDMIRCLFDRKIDPKTKIVIWMPTFRKSSLDGYRENDIALPYELPAVSGKEEMHFLDECCRKRNILLIIKKHPLQIGWEEKQENFTNIIYVTDRMLDKKDVLLYHLVGVCDALISDYSSIAVDYLLLDRPVGFVLTDFEEYKKTRGFVFEDPLAYMPGEKIYDFVQLKTFLEHVADGKDLFREERRRVLPLMHQQAGQTGNYSARILDYLGINKTEI